MQFTQKDAPIAYNDVGAVACSVCGQLLLPSGNDAILVKGSSGSWPAIWVHIGNCFMKWFELEGNKK